MYIRQTVEALTEAKPLEQGQDAPHSDAQSSRGRAASDAKGGPVTAPACVPFFGELSFDSSFRSSIDPAPIQACIYLS